jgi:hypothetical protein
VSTWVSNRFAGGEPERRLTWIKGIVGHLYSAGKSYVVEGVAVFVCYWQVLHPTCLPAFQTRLKAGNADRISASRTAMLVARAYTGVSAIDH